MADENKTAYASREWHTGDVITADALNKIENEIEYVSAEVTNAVTGTINDQKLNDTLARKLDSVVKYFPDTPNPDTDLEYVRMYAQPSTEGTITVPTEEEYLRFKQNFVQPFTNKAYVAGNYVEYEDEIYKVKSAIAKNNSAADDAAAWEAILALNPSPIRGPINVMQEVDNLINVYTNDSQLTSEQNRIWIQQNGQSVEVPTYEEFTDLKSAFIASTGNGVIEYTLQNGYYTTSTVGNTVDFNSPSRSNNFEAVIVECTPGDVFTINGIGGSNGRLWAFLDVDKKVVRRETLNTQMNGKVITAQTGEVYLVINNNKTTVPDAVSYKGEVLTDKVSRIEETAMIAKTASGTETAFSDLLEMGVYGFSKAQMSAMVDKPSDVDDAVGTLINYSGAYLTGAYTIQRLYQLSGKAWERLLYTPTGEVSKAWERTDSGANVDNSNILKGKKLVTAGDSYTQAYWDGDYADYNGKNYGYYIAQRNNMTFVNSGISGSTMAVTKTGSGHNPFVVDRYTAVPADTDYLILWFGINDAANCNLGTIDDEVNNTFYGAWNTVLRYYLTNRPWMKVLIVVTTGAIGWDGDTRLDFRQAIRNVAEKWGYPYLDWEKDKGIPAFFDREGMSTEARDLRRNAYGYNGPNVGHPNPQWYEYESTIIEAKLRSI